MQVNIMGIRGIPAAHGGFETFAARLAPYLRDRGHAVTVYCQEDEGAPGPWEDDWEGIHRIHFCPKRQGPIGTMEFDLACVTDVLKRPGLDLVLGYNTAIFNILQRIRGRSVIMNMDGIEWKRAKWSLPAKVWFYVNEVIGANMCQVAVADHPQIGRHVSRRCFKTPVVIPYGAERIDTAPVDPVTSLGLLPERYFVSISRLVPENSILEMVRAFSSLDTDVKFVVIGRLEDENAYHQAILSAAGPSVVFPGPIYDATTVSALRFHALAYLHGHQVGGTNPSLVEALGAGNAVLAHDNKFNRWTAGDEQLFFDTEAKAAQEMTRLAGQRDVVVKAKNAARQRHSEAFNWEEDILPAYEHVLLQASERQRSTLGQMVGLRRKRSER